MKRSHKILVSLAAATAIAASSAASAFATDLLEEEVISTEVEFGTGWYIRGDIGSGISNAEFESNIFSGTSELGQPITATLGAGYQASDAIRIEVGLNYFDELSGRGRSGSAPCAAVTGNCFSETTSDVTASSFMLNGYLDLKNSTGFTPYVGAGVGLAYLSWNGFTASEFCTGAVAADCGGAGAGTSLLATNVYATDNDFALAANLMLGVSYDLTENAKIDVGYRYTYFGETDIAQASANPGLPSNITSDSMDMHEIRVGLRYEIW